MKVDILEEKDNKLMERKEVRVMITGRETTPKRVAVRGVLAKTLGVKEENIWIDSIDQKFGEKAAEVCLKVYKKAVEHPRDKKAREKEKKAAEAKTAEGAPGEAPQKPESSGETKAGQEKEAKKEAEKPAGNEAKENAAKEEPAESKEQKPVEVTPTTKTEADGVS